MMYKLKTLAKNSLDDLTSLCDGCDTVYLWLEYCDRGESEDEAFGGCFLARISLGYG